MEHNGLSVIPVDSRHVQLCRGGQSFTFRVVLFDRRVHPRDIGEPPERNSLLVAPVMSAAAASTARAQGWSVVCDEGPAWIRFHGGWIELKSDRQTDAVMPSRRRGRPGYGVFSVLRTMLALEGGATQSELAEFAKVSQPRVSQAIDMLRALGLVMRAEHGWVVTDNDAAIDWWIDHYPGPAGLRTEWYGLDSVAQQAYQTYEFLTKQGAAPVVSGDVAADLISPWRTPRHALLYATRGADLTRIGLTPSRPADATLTVVLPDDPAVRPLGPARLVELPGMGAIARANSLQVLWDLKQGNGPDVEEAASAWLRWIRRHKAVV